MQYANAAVELERSPLVYDKHAIQAAGEDPVLIMEWNDIGLEARKRQIPDFGEQPEKAQSDLALDTINGLETMTGVHYGIRPPFMDVERDFLPTISEIKFDGRINEGLEICIRHGAVGDVRSGPLVHLLVIKYHTVRQFSEQRDRLMRLCPILAPSPRPYPESGVQVMLRVLPTGRSKTDLEVLHEGMFDRFVF